MPTARLYPGVYIEEVPSGVRPISGISTSDTAFVDWFPRGPVDGAVRITSLTGFERVFGGLDTASEASYAIRQYYLNGGRVAWIVRVTSDAATALRVLSAAQSYGGWGGSGSGGAPGAGIVRVEAASPGVWGNQVQVGFDVRDVPLSAGSPTGYNLVVREVVTVGGKRIVTATEAFRNLNGDATSSRFGPTVVNRESRLVRLTQLRPGELPAVTGADVIGDPNSARWLILGQSGFQQGRDVLPAPPEWGTIVATPGDDGTTPADEAWVTSAGANALLGRDGTSQAVNRGLRELERIAPAVFNLLCVPGVSTLSADSARDVLAEATALCEAQRAFLLVDPPADVDTVADMVAWTAGDTKPQSDHAAVYFPSLLIADPLRENELRAVGPSGTMAGVYARTDADRGVWKAPAGIEASLRGATLPLKLTDLETAALNPIGANALRSFPLYGNVAWGARTLEGSDAQASEWKYVPVRRTALFIEESLFQGLKWVVFEPNAEPLWAQIRLNVGAFMQVLFRQGAFAGTTPREAYLVKCDNETTTPADVNVGVVNIIVGFAPLRPAEFVIIQIQQLAGQVQV